MSLGITDFALAEPAFDAADSALPLPSTRETWAVEPTNGGFQARLAPGLITPQGA
jgi:hypothetical protein